MSKMTTIVVICTIVSFASTLSGCLFGPKDDTLLGGGAAVEKSSTAWQTVDSWPAGSASVGVVTQKMRVDGGYIYRTIVSGNDSSMCFVPDPTSKQAERK